MGTRIERRGDGVVLLTVEHPPVNALPRDGWSTTPNRRRLRGRHVRVAGDRPWRSRSRHTPLAAGSPAHDAALFYTGRTVTAQQLEHFDLVWQVVAREDLLDTALELAVEIAAKDPLIIRKAKASLDGIDTVDVHRSYRFEQGFTFELYLDGVADRVRNTFGRPEGPTTEGHAGSSAHGRRK